MNTWLSKIEGRRKHEKVETYLKIADGLKDMYTKKLFPLEQYYFFNEFHSPRLEESDFESKPMILLVGQYSTGKTTFIRYILEQDFPGMRIGPEPTTDKFLSVMYGEVEGVIPGNALVVDPTKQFRQLSKFGNTFLNKLQCSLLRSPVLQSVSLVDTPGIMAGEKHILDRGYDFTGVLRWFAERVDRILMLFDAHKLDISDELKRTIETLAGHEDKTRIILNKADMLDHQELLRVYGALMWSLGKVLRSPEVVRVYVGSFWDQPLRNDFNRNLFQAEEHDLFADLQSLPKYALLRKLNDFIKRARLAKAHALICAELKKQMPMMVGKQSKRMELIQNIHEIYRTVQAEHNIPPGDFPDIRKFQETLMAQDFSKFKPIKAKLIDTVSEMLAKDISALMTSVSQSELLDAEQTRSIHGGAIGAVREDDTPFGFGRFEGTNAGVGEMEWIVNRDRAKYDAIFHSIKSIENKVSGTAAREEMIKSKLPNAMLRKIWKLADLDNDGMLDQDEFALAMYLMDIKQNGYEIPNMLPSHLIPPNKRTYYRPSSSQMSSKN